MSFLLVYAVAVTGGKLRGDQIVRIGHPLRIGRRETAAITEQAQTRRIRL